VGNVNTDLQYFEQVIDEVKNNPNAYLLGLGDWIEGITPDDKRFELDTIDKNYLDGNLILNQVNYLKDKFKKLSSLDKIIGLHSGNHDDKLKKKFTMDFIKSICDELNIEYLGFSAYTRLKIVRDNRSTSFDIYSTHGSIAGRKKGNKINRLEEMSGWYDADMYFMGHSHDMFLSYDNQYYLTRKGKIAEKIKLFGNSGCFLKGVQYGTESYAEKANYSPNRIGYLKIKIYPELNLFTGQEINKLNR